MTTRNKAYIVNKNIANLMFSFLSLIYNPIRKAIIKKQKNSNDIV